MDANSSCSPQIIDKANHKSTTQESQFGPHKSILLRPLRFFFSLPMSPTTDAYSSPSTFLYPSPCLSPCFMLLFYPVRTTLCRSSSATLKPRSAWRPGDRVAPLTKCIFPLPNDSSATGRLEGRKDETGGGSGEEAPVSLLHWTSMGKYWKTKWYRPFEDLYILNLKELWAFFLLFQALGYWISFPISFLETLPFCLSLTLTHDKHQG